MLERIQNSEVSSQNSRILTTDFWLLTTEGFYA
jgi:hypothetical protein